MGDTSSRLEIFLRAFKENGAEIAMHVRAISHSKNLIKSALIALAVSAGVSTNAINFAPHTNKPATKEVSTRQETPEDAQTEYERELNRALSKGFRQFDPIYSGFERPQSP